MCGIAGAWTRHGEAFPLKPVVKTMCDAIAHRGPDDSGLWQSQDGAVVLGHRRLSIIDLSPAGHQPMLSADRRFAMVFNGEIYNFQEIREDLQARGVSFRGHSDTEVMLEAFSQWGIAATIPRFAGMFAFAVWDSRENTLTLARDRVGKKPLYYANHAGTMYFASELRAIDAVARLPLDPQGVASFVKYSCTRAPASILAGAHKLLPGHTLTIPSQGPMPPATPYWKVSEVAKRGVRTPPSEQSAIDQLESLLETAVKQRMISDVPLGAFLSGGIDSSTVVALMQANSEKPIKTFTIGFLEAGYNEAEHAAKVAEHLGTEHHEQYVTAEDAIKTVHKLPYVYDEPFADSSQIPTILVSRLARKHVTVALSGDGGDEVFAGYSRYSWGEAIHRQIRRAPAPLRRGAAQVVQSVSPSSWDRVGSFGRTIGLRRIPPAFGDKMHKGAALLSARSRADLYDRLVSHWNPAEVLREPTMLAPPAFQWQERESFVEEMMLRDTTQYLPDDILVKVDRATMSESLEGRAPLLDHRVIEFAWTLPLSYKMRDGQGKWILRQVLARHVPTSLTDRPKMGFGVPIDSWLRGPLKDWAANLLDRRRLEEQRLLNPDAVLQKWNEHLSGRRNWQHHLWDVLMLQVWLDARGAGTDA